MKIVDLLGGKAEYYLNHTCKTIDKQLIHIPGPDMIDKVWMNSDRNIRTLESLQALYGHGRLANTGYVSILPVDQGIEHSAGASFAPNPLYFDPENIIKLAIEGGCNAVASTFGVLGAVARKYAHKIPFIVKLNHNELLTYPNSYDQVMFGTVKEAWNMGAVAVGATIYFGSEQSRRQIVEVSQAFEYAHELGMATILWCYLRNSSFKKDGTDYHAAADLTGQANHIGVTIKADIVKQKLPSNNGGFKAIGFGKTNECMYSELTTDHLIPLKATPDFQSMFTRFIIPITSSVSFLTIVNLKLFLSTTVLSVSYTHLDVYKRQIVHHVAICFKIALYLG